MLHYTVLIISIKCNALLKQNKDYVLYKGKKIREGNLKLYRNVLEQAESFRFLGVDFDTRLTWRENIKYEMDIICHGYLSGLAWRASIIALKYIYIALIRSRLDYRSIVHGSATEPVLVDLDRVQSRALRVCLEAVRTFPVCALQVEAEEMPL